ncbi:MAG TPA: peroxiredoxin family protein [Polyangia bacterium]
MDLLSRAFGLLGIESSSGSVRVGDQAPDFTLSDSEGNQVNLKAALKGGPVLLAFFPAAFTSGCTAELRSFGGRYDELIARGARLFAVSMDRPETLDRFRSSLRADFPFLSDPDGTVSRLYAGVTAGRSKRVTVTIDADGKVARLTTGARAIFPGGDIVACPRRKEPAMG